MFCFVLGVQRTKDGAFLSVSRRYAPRHPVPIRFLSFLCFSFLLLLLSCSISLPSFIHSASIEAAAVRDTDRTVQ